MSSMSRVFASLLASVLGIVVMVVLATVVFFITTFVVATGSSLAGYDPSGDFVVLAASLIVVAVILTGGLTPRMTQQFEPLDAGPADVDDPMYD